MGFRYGRTVTASVVRTAAAGRRVEIADTSARFFSGDPGEEAPGFIRADYDAGQDATILYLYSPDGPDTGGVQTPPVGFELVSFGSGHGSPRAPYSYVSAVADVFACEQVEPGTLAVGPAGGSYPTAPPVKGLDFGTFQGSDTAGNFTVPHGLGVTPSVVLASLDNRLAGGVEKWHVIVGELTSTAFGAHVNDNTGVNVDKEVTILWVAIA